MTGRRDGESALARIARNGALTASADILSKLCSLAFFALLAREFGDAALGHYVFALALTSLTWAFAGFGLDRMAMRDIAQDPAAMVRVAVPMAALKGLGAVLLTAITAAVLAIAGEPSEVIWLVVLLGGQISLSMSAATAQAIFSAHERMEHVFLTKVPWSLAAAAAGIAVVLAGGGLVLAVAVSALGIGVPGAAWAWWIVVRAYERPSLRLRVREWPGMLKRAIPFGTQEMLGQIIFRFDTVLLGAVAASAVVGAYGAAYRMLEATLFIAWSVGFSVMPTFSYLPAGDELTRLYEAAVKLVAAITAPIAAVFFVCAPAIIDLIYGLPEYEASIDILRLLAFAVAIYSIGHISGLLVLVRRPGRVTVALSAFVAVTNVIACAVLIPAFEGVGAAVATILGEVLLAALGVAFSWSVTGPQRLWWVLGSPVIASLAMGLAMWPVADDLWLALPAGAAVYVAVLLALEARRLRDDLALFRSIRAGRPDAAMAEDPVLS